jgi:predicted phosphodiesterase
VWAEDPFFLLWQPEQLREETVDFLRALPQVRRLKIAGVSLLVAHGTPWDHGVYVYYNTQESVFERLVHEAAADVVLLGHTHIPMAIKKQHTWIFNPGSVSHNRRLNDRTCGLLHLPDCVFTVVDIDTGACKRLPPLA